jgi:hypothetical protein
LRGHGETASGIRANSIGLISLLIALLSSTTTAQNPYSAWKSGPNHDPAFFPIAVWLQSPTNAASYKAAGFNTFVGLWEGPTEEQLAQLRRAGMAVVCAQNDVALKHLNDPTIIAWMHGDEPDNAQPVLGISRWGDPVAPEKIVAQYQTIQRNDPSRPILLNLGQGVAWDGWIGRGKRTNHPEDYMAYLQGCDIASFDIYPVTHEHPDVAGQLWRVPFGVHRLRTWSADKKIVWNCIETTRISNLKTKPTPAQVRSEVWMSIIAGSRGIIYFAHQFEPKFVEAEILHDSEMLAEITKLNQEIQKLAPVLNGPDVKGVTIESTDKEHPAEVMAKMYEGSLYFFISNPSGHNGEVTIHLPIDVRDLEVRDGIAPIIVSDTSGRTFTISIAANSTQIFRAIPIQ